MQTLLRVTAYCEQCGPKIRLVSVDAPASSPTVDAAKKRMRKLYATEFHAGHDYKLTFEDIR